MSDNTVFVIRITTLTILRVTMRLFGPYQGPTDRLKVYVAKQFNPYKSTKQPPHNCDALQGMPASMAPSPSS
jgi:hypothetical protein